MTIAEILSANVVRLYVARHGQANTFTYDGSGRRISKNGITYTYDGSGRLIASSDRLEFLYDNAGVFAVKRGEMTYLYRKDA